MDPDTIAPLHDQTTGKSGVRLPEPSLHERADIRNVAVAIAILTSIWPSYAYALSGSEVLANTARAVEQFGGVLSWVAMLTGSTLGVVSLFRMVKHAQGRDQAGIGSIIATLLIGSILLSASSMMETASQSIFNSNVSALTYGVGKGNASALGVSSCAVDAVGAVFVWVMFIGWVAFIKGWLLIKAAADGKNASYGNGITFVFGGVLAANIHQVVDMLKGTLGIDLGSISC